MTLDVVHDMVCKKNTHAMTLAVVHENNTHAMTLVDQCVVYEKNRHAMTLVDPYVVCLEEHTCNHTRWIHMWFMEVTYMK